MSSLYLHIPFCRRKCPYCDFYSRADHPDLLDTYPQLLLRQLQLALTSGWSGPFSSVFFGGGTPSLLAPSRVSQFLKRLADGPGLHPDAEITLEANPATLDLPRLQGYARAGINRLSLGIQSFSDPQLKRLGRLHDGQQARRSLALAREAGFENLSCDLMFALPGQSSADLQHDLEELIELLPEHISIYGLSIEPGSHWGRFGGPELPGEEAYATGYQLIHELLGAKGYCHYEISNFARPGRECLHNLGYWRRQSSLGLGAGAHGFNSKGWGARWQTPADLDAYDRSLRAGKDPMRLLEEFDRKGAMAETVYLGLRTAEGIDASSFQKRFGVSFEMAFADVIPALEPHWRRESGHWRLSADAWLIYDHLITAFL